MSRKLSTIPFAFFNTWIIKRAHIHQSRQTPIVSFGYQQVNAAEKATLVKEVFEKVANRYDLMNDIMTAGIHRIWKDRLVSYIQFRRGMRILDVAGGTGDVAFRILDKAIRKEIENFEMTLLDINESMLAVGRRRAEEEGFREGLKWVVGDAEKLPFGDNSFDIYTIAFGIRNCIHLDQVLQEAYRILRPGGSFLCLELSPDAFANSPWLKSLYDRYSFDIIPIYGQLFAADRLSYQYLVESIRKFPGRNDFSLIIAEARFEKVRHESLVNNIAVIHSAWKPNMK